MNTNSLTDLMTIVERAVPPIPWAEGDKIPWNEPSFSERMLREHLSQAHDGASRRDALIDAHVAWIHDTLLGGRRGRVLDLGCGPGLYTSRLARLGHDCVGIDFSPASIAYAQEQSPDVTYIQGDVRTTEFGAGYDLVMFIYGELNVFRPDDARLILTKARAALRPGGRLLLEVHPYDVVRAKGDVATTWRTSRGGLFSPVPQLLLEEAFWDEPTQTAMHRYYVIDAATTAVSRFAETMQAWSDDDYRTLLSEAGFRTESILPSLTGGTESGDLVVVVGHTAD